jgi:RNA polymerase sigma-70 factor (ECF subfamily)
MNSAETGHTAGGQTPDSVLIAAIQNGDNTAWEPLFERYRRPVYAFISRMLNGDAMTADDVFQDLWIKVMNKIAAYQDDGRFAAWLFRIARNQVLEHFRREKSRSKIGQVTDDGELPEQISSSNSPVSALAEKELSERLEKLLNELPPEQKEVFIMRQNNLSFKEIAAIQKCPLNTALGRMHNCLKFLRHRLCL